MRSQYRSDRAATARTESADAELVEPEFADAELVEPEFVA